MEDFPQASSPVLGVDNSTNLFYLHEFFENVAQDVSQKMSRLYDLDIPITSGLWGGTYLIATDEGKCKRRVWRFYCIVNLPQNTPLDQHENLECLIDLYREGFAKGFKSCGMALELKEWGGQLPYSNKKKPSLTLHMVDANKRIHWLRAFFVWNLVSWEESTIFDTIRLINILKEWLDPAHGPVLRDPILTRFFLQDVIIAYRTLESACKPKFLEQAEPIIGEMTLHFLLGLHNHALIRELYSKVYDSGIWKGLDEVLGEAYRKTGLDVYGVGGWPVEKINWVPDELKEKLVPPLQRIFVNYKANLDKKSHQPA